jgi:E3 ubiquitin-protein ligase SH3RF
MSTAGQTSRGVTMVSPSTAGGPAQKLQGNGVAGVSAAHIQTSPQAKVLLHMTGQMTVNQARNAVRTGKKETGLEHVGRVHLPCNRSFINRC